MSDYCYHCMEPMDGGMFCTQCGSRNSAVTSAPHQLPPGSMLQSRYLIGRVLGQGGFGITYIGRDTRLNMRVAIKEYFPSGYANRNASASMLVTITDTQQQASVLDGKRRFLAEAQALGKFHGTPGIVDVRDFFEENNTAYIVMEYLDGQDLRQLLDKRLFTANEIFSLMRPVMDALEVVHAAGVIHRDISPDNIMMMPDGSLKLMDFGAARQVGGNVQKSMSVMLKSGYAPEEQYRSRGNLGPWTDIYALCATMYKCITGITPVESIERAMSATELIRWPSQLGKPISQTQEAVLRAGMQVRLEERIQNIAELKQVLSGQIDPEKTRVAPAGVETERTKVAPGMAAAGNLKQPAASKNSGAGIPSVKPASAPAANAAGKPEKAAKTAKTAKNEKTDVAAKSAQSAKDGKKKKKGGLVAVLLILVVLAVGGGIWYATKDDGSGSSQEHVEITRQPKESPEASAEEEAEPSGEVSPSPSPSEQAEPTSTPTPSPEAKDDTVTVKPIAENTITIADIESSSAENTTVTFQNLSGEISEGSTTWSCTVTPVVDGRCRFDLSEVVSGTEFNLVLRNALDEEVARANYCENGEGLTATGLTANETYTFTVEQCREYGTFDLTVGFDKAELDISDITQLSDSVEFTGQRNCYRFVPQETGRYHFEISELHADTELKVVLQDDLEAEVTSNNYCKNGGAITADLTAGEEYTLYILQSEGTSSFNLNIWSQKAQTDISSLTGLTDSIQFVDQQNCYAFTPSCDGKYRFSVSGMLSETEVNIRVTDHLGQEVSSGNCGNDTGISMDLTAGESYTVYVKYRSGLSTYQLSIGQQKPTVSINGAITVNDSIVYRDQRNNYTLDASGQNLSITASGMESGTRISVYIYNNLGETVAKYDGMENGSLLETDAMTAGSTYTVCVSWYDGTGDYTLTIGK